MLRRLIFSNLLLLLVSVQAMADVSQGFAALRVGNFGAAYSQLSLAAQAGDSDAQFAMCGMYFQGQGVPKNLVEAFQWCKLAADQGNVEAMYNTALFYQKGEGVGQNYNEAMRLYRSAADAGHKDAQFNLLQLYNANALASQAGTAGGLKGGLLPPVGVALDSTGNALSYNPLKVPSAAVAGAAGGVALAQGIPQSLSPTALQGTAQAVSPQSSQQVPQSFLDQLSSNVASVPSSAVQAPARVAQQIPTIPTQPLNAAEQQRYVVDSACLKAARQGIVADNCGEKKVASIEPKKLPASVVKKEEVDLQNTLGWFEKQAELGDVEAQNNLGVIYRRGTGVPKQPEKALALFEKSAARGSVNGMLNLANMYKLGEGAEQNLELSYAWYNLAADRLRAGASKRAALANIKEIASFMTNEEIGSALEYVTQLDSSIPLLEEEIEGV